MENLSKKFSNYLLVSSLGSNVIGSIFVLFLSSIKGFNVKEISLILGTTPLIVLPIFFAWESILDKYKSVIKLSKFVNISNIITMMMLIITNNFMIFFVVNLIRTILLQPSGTLNDKYTLNISKINKGSYGNIRVRSTIGYGLAGIISPIAIKLGGVYLAILVGIVLIGLSIFIITKIPDITEDNTENETIKRDEKSLITSIGTLIKNKNYIKYLIIISIIWGTQNAASGYGIQIMLIDLKVPNSIIGLIPFIMVIFEVIFLLIYEKIKLFKKSDIALLISLIILAFRWTTMIFTKSYILILLITMLHGIVTGVVLQIQNKIVGDIVPSHQHFLAFILLNSLSATILPSILNLLIGSLYYKFGITIFGTVYLSLALIAIIILISKLINKKSYIK